jgi:rubrerythrin
MNNKKITSVVKSKLLSIIPLTIPIAFIFFLSCQKTADEKKEVKPAITAENLQTAYSKEVNRHKMYEAFSARAEKDKMKQIAHLYRAIGRSEEIHSLCNLKLLRNFGVDPKPPKDEYITVGTTPQTLKMALSMEDIEYGMLYKSIIRCAEVEHHADCANILKAIQDAEGKHAELLRYAIYKGKDMPALQYFVCKECGYVLTTEQTDECPACKAKRETFEKL